MAVANSVAVSIPPTPNILSYPLSFQLLPRVVMKEIFLLDAVHNCFGWFFCPLQYFIYNSGIVLNPDSNMRGP